MPASRIILSRCLFALLFPAMFAPAQAQLPEPADPGRPGGASLAAPNLPPHGLLDSTRAVPPASADKYRMSRDYPCVDIGFGLRTFSPDLSGLSKVYGGTPSFGLSPIVSGVVELACTENFGAQVDAGASFASGDNQAYQGLAGLEYRCRPSSSPDLRLCFGAGVAVCSFRGESSLIIAEGGATGFYTSAGLGYPLGRDRTMEIYAGYCSYPRVSTVFPSYATPETPGINASVKLSSVIVGLRLKRLM
jgi:hypothetical protein